MLNGINQELELAELVHQILLIWADNNNIIIGAGELLED